MHEVIINGCSVFFEELEQLQVPDEVHDSFSEDVPLTWTEAMLKKAVQPLVDALGMIREATKTMAPDELELSLQLQIAVSGNTPVFKVLSMGGNAQIAAKFVWKKS